MSKNLFELLNLFGKTYGLLRVDEKKRKKSVIFGLISIIFSLICVALPYPCIWAGAHGIKYACTTYLGFFTYFLLIGNATIFALSLSTFIVPYFLWIYGIVFVVRQLTLNRRVIGWIALVIWIASVVGISIVTIKSLDAIVNPMLAKN